MLKRLMLPAYYYGSLPLRRLQAARRERLGRAPVMVLFYHRVADTCPNGWTMSNRQFARQIRWLRDHFDLVSLAEAQQRIRAGRNTMPAVSITFDDGYAENLGRALPLLLEAKIPVTYFVSTHNVVQGTPFPHDAAAGRPLRPNTLAELRGLVRAGVEIGAHTRSHADLGKVDEQETLVDELVAARDELAAAIDAPIRYFAFPFGQVANLSRAAFELAQASDYDGVCSAYGGYNWPGDDAFHLRRLHADPGMLRLKNWLSVDPRKVDCGSQWERAAGVMDGTSSQGKMKTSPLPNRTAPLS